MENSAYIILSQVASELTLRRVDASRNDTRFDRDAFVTWVKQQFGDAYIPVALLLLALDTGPALTQHFHGSTKMTNNSVGGNVIGAVGEGNQVSASNSAIGSFNKGQQVPLPEAHEKFLECIQKMTELAEAEKAEAKAQADSLKVELEKPAKERNAGFIGRTFKKLCAVAPEAAGQFFGNFTAAYLEHKKVVNFSRRRCQGLLF